MRRTPATCPSDRSPDLHHAAHRRAKPGQHVDERIRTEQIDPSTKEIADARLGHTEYLDCSSLFETARLDELLNLDHQVRSDQQMLGLFVPKPEVTEYVPSGRRNLQFLGAGHMSSSTKGKPVTTTGVPA